MEAPGTDTLLIQTFMNTAGMAATNANVFELLNCWLEEYFDSLRCEWSQKTEQLLNEADELSSTGNSRRFNKLSYKDAFLRKVFRSMAQDAERALRENRCTTRDPIKAVEVISENFGLSLLQKEIVLLVRASIGSAALWNLLTHLSRLDGGLEGAIAIALGVTKEDVFKSFWSPETGMVDLGLVKSDYQRRDSENVIRILRSQVREAIFKPYSDPSDLEYDFLGKPCHAEVTCDQFSHIGRERDIIIGTLRGAVEGKAKGVNILIYGPPGTGKTELAKAVCSYLGYRLFAVGEDSRIDEPERDRLGALLMAQNLLGNRNKSVLLFDEMEDIADDSYGSFGSERAVSSKVFLNRILERNQTPVIWVANHPRILGDSVLRRMSYVLRLDVPDYKVRAKMFQAACERKGLSIDSNKLDEIARDFAIPPALIEKAAETANFLDNGAGHMHHIISSLAKASGFADPNKAEGEKAIGEKYDPSLINVKGSGPKPDTLLELLKGSPTKSFSLCLNGPPGTGKTAFAKYLAKELALPLVEKRASDILGPFVGQSEKAIASAFEEAKRNEALLFIDEADSLLSDRRHAVRSWEVTQVNELLSQMQDHPYPIVMATNFIEHLDQASLRRFTFKLEFGFLTQDQVARAFELYFASVPPKEVLAMELLTAGDFATVHKKAVILGELNDLSALARHLEMEVHAKVEFGGQSRRVGFGR